MKYFFPWFVKSVLEHILLYLAVHFTLETFLHSNHCSSLFHIMRSEIRFARGNFSRWHKMIAVVLLTIWQRETFIRLRRTYFKVQSSIWLLIHFPYLLLYTYFCDIYCTFVQTHNDRNIWYNVIFLELQILTFILELSCLRIIFQFNFQVKLINIHKYLHMFLLLDA